MPRRHIDDGDATMKYMLLLYANESAFQGLPKPRRSGG